MQARETEKARRRKRKEAGHVPGVFQVDGNWELILRKDFFVRKHGGAPWERDTAILKTSLQTPDEATAVMASRYPPGGAIAT